MRGETFFAGQFVSDFAFQSTPLMRGETTEASSVRGAISISIHSPHTRGDARAMCRKRTRLYFNPLPSCEGRRRPPRWWPSPRPRFQSTPLIRGETRLCRARAVHGEISIHSPHTRGDAEIIRNIDGQTISIHSPHTRGDYHARLQNHRLQNFNPLPSYEGRPDFSRAAYGRLYDFNPLPSYEGRHAALTAYKAAEDFNPLPSYEGRQSEAEESNVKHIISIHSPHARGDICRVFLFYTFINFNPLPSCEGRRLCFTHITPIHRFQSTPLMRGETKFACAPHAAHVISIHSPHARGDQRSPRACQGRLISIHSPHARGDDIMMRQGPQGIISIHSPHARGDNLAGIRRVNQAHFNPLPSCEGRQAGHMEV